jgi:hypothetical protein
LLVEHRRELVNNQTRLLKRLTSTLKGYFPQILAWFQPLDTQVADDGLRNGRTGLDSGDPVFGRWHQNGRR